MIEFPCIPSRQDKYNKYIVNNTQSSYKLSFCTLCIQAYNAVYKSVWDP